MVAPVVHKDRVDPAPFGGSKIETFLPGLVDAPAAREKSLVFETAKHWIEGAFLDIQTRLTQILPDLSAVAFAFEYREDGEDQSAASKLEAQRLGNAR